MRIQVYIYFILLSSFLAGNIYSQCGPSTPTFSVNLTGNPGGSWLSPNIVRNDVCCGQNGVNCIKFVITLDPAAVGIEFSIASGATPGGALNYQVNCGPQTTVGNAICLSGVGPHILTFCKPGGNSNTYQIKSVPPVFGGNNLSLNNGCTKNFVASGYNPTSTVWTSIAPGAQGAYNNYLSCTSGCTTTSIIPIGTPPAFIDYKVCGQPSAQCNFNTICDTVRVYFNPTLSVSIVPQNPTICFGQTSTTLSAIGGGGSPPYSYLWNNVNPSQTINVGAGTYNVQLNDASGCAPVFASASVTSFTSAITAKAGPDKIKCKQSPLVIISGSVTGVSTGIWSGGSGTFSPNNITLANVSYSPTAAELTAGVANLILTTTGNGSCPPSSDTLKIIYQNFTGTIVTTQTNVSCNGLSNGSASVSITGGYPTYTYLWNTTPTNTTGIVSGLSAGNYIVSIGDGIGCASSSTVTITQPLPLSIVSNTLNTPCFGSSGGSFTITPTGGTPIYNYSWTPVGASTPTLGGLPAGTYSVKVTDSKGCSTTSVQIVSQPPALLVNLTFTNNLCFGSNDGVATTTVSGGTTPYTYSWSPNGLTSANNNNLSVGNHTVYVTDAKGCISSNTLQIISPTDVTVTPTFSNETCNYLNNGTASLSVGGGSPTYSYTWFPAATNTNSLVNLTAGLYSYTVTDSKSCKKNGVITITEPLQLTVSISSTSVSCFGGSNGLVSANVSGGTANYTYSWSPSGGTGSTASGLSIGIYSVLVKDANNCVASNTITITQPSSVTVTNTITNVSCNGGSDGTISLGVTGGVTPYSYLWYVAGQTTSTIGGLALGTYSVKITDGNNCSQTINYGIIQPTALLATTAQTNVSCKSGSNAASSIMVSGGTAGYTYNWMPSSQTSSLATGLSTGIYTVIATDSKGCVITKTVSITEPLQLLAIATVSNESCNYLNDGKAFASQSGGTGGFTYSWSPLGQTTSSISSLSSGVYTLQVTDSKGCIATTTTSVTEPLVIAISFTNQSNVSCFGGSNGLVSANVSGGTANYTYSWSPINSTSNLATNLSSGIYTVQIKDANNCIGTNTIFISQPSAPISIVVSSTSTACNGGNTGKASAMASGGTPGYTYVWHPTNSTGNLLSNLPSGTYSVIVTDINNCILTQTVFVNEPAPILPVTTGTSSTCETQMVQALFQLLVAYYHTHINGLQLEELVR